jgi:hypothetical protein
MNVPTQATWTTQPGISTARRTHHTPSYLHQNVGTDAGHVPVPPSCFPLSTSVPSTGIFAPARHPLSEARSQHVVRGVLYLRGKDIPHSS